MAATAVDANTFYNKLKAEPDDKLKLGDKQVVLQTTTGPNQVLKLDTKPEGDAFIKALDDDAPYPAPASSRPNAGIVHSAAAEMLRNPGGGREEGKYQPALTYSKWGFPGNALDAAAAAKPNIGASTAYADWESSIKSELQKDYDGGTAKLLVFVHGYNTLPEQACDTAHRLLQPEADGGLNVQAVVAFTWDSAGRALSYFDEEPSAESGALSDHLSGLIQRLLRIKLANGKQWQLIILAHSMGNRPTTLALGKVYHADSEALKLNTADAPMLIINAAADIDAYTYSTIMKDVMGMLGNKARAIVLCSDRDGPLIMSYSVHDRFGEGNGREQRVGLLLREAGGCGVWGFLRTVAVPVARLRNFVGGLISRGGKVVKVPSMDVIDCSIPSGEELAAGGNGHSYFIHGPKVRAELVAAMGVPSTAQRLRNNANNAAASLVEAPKGSGKPFVIFDGPLYKILAA